jgi:hypothetical protein
LVTNPRLGTVASWPRPFPTMAIPITSALSAGIFEY